MAQWHLLFHQPNITNAFFGTYLFSCENQCSEKVVLRHLRMLEEVCLRKGFWAVNESVRQQHFLGGN